METLKTSAQFERVRREGRTWGAGLLVLNAARNGEERVRCGFITGKKVGKAVQRNRARRLIREAVRKRLAEIAPGWDLVWIARAAIVGTSYGEVCKAVDELLQRSKIVAPIDSRSSEKIETAGPQSRIIDVAGNEDKVAAPIGGGAQTKKPASQQ
jgi:ribonuclease P protein component